MFGNKRLTIFAPKWKKQTTDRLPKKQIYTQEI